MFEIDRILSAEKCGNKYRLWVKWKDYADATPMWRHDLLKQNCNEELLQEVADAVQRCRDQLNIGREPDDDPVVGDETAITDEVVVVPGTHGRPGRNRQAPARFAFLVRPDGIVGGAESLPNVNCDELLQSLDEPLVLSSLRAIQMNADMTKTRRVFATAWEQHVM